MTGAPLLVPNLAAEEGAAWRQPSRKAAARRVAELWRLLFAADAELAGGLLDAPPPAGLVTEGAAFPWLAAAGHTYAWLNTEEAREIATRAGRPLFGAAPEVVREVHDKAFARAAADAEGFVPARLRGVGRTLDPGLLAEPEAALAAVRAEVAGWPEWTGGRFTLKPRFGSSGRGRVAGRRDALAAPALRGALPRLAARGGALLEPWLERRADYASLLLVQPDGGVLLLGTVEQLLAPSGLYLGHRGELDARGRVHAGGAFDEELREPAVALARCAALRGYRGPCGIDALVYLTGDGRPELRPVVELNARFTVGTVVVGLLRRALPLLRDGIGMPAERRRAFYFAMRPPPGGWPRPEPGAAFQLVPLRDPPRDEGAALLVAEDRAALDALLGIDSVGIEAVDQLAT